MSRFDSSCEDCTAFGAGWTRANTVVVFRYMLMKSKSTLLSHDARSIGTSFNDVHVAFVTHTLRRLVVKRVLPIIQPMMFGS